MKRLPVLSNLIFVAGLVYFSSCSKKNITVQPIVSSTPLQALINSDTSLSIYYAAVKKAGANALYGGTDSAIVLIPGNAAFTAQGISLATINALSAASADSLLRYHYLPGPVSLVAGAYQSYNTKLGMPVYGYGAIDSSGVYFNGISAVYQKLPGSNATVYKLNAPLQPPFSSPTQLLASDTLLDYFAEALKHTGLGIIPGSGWNTVLAPVNAAFISAGYPTLSSIDNADIAQLSNILQYHILPGQHFSHELAGLSTVPTLQGTNINISFADSTLGFTGPGNTAATTLIKANRVVGSSIVVHEINELLMP
jgi:uncharacterized surface protein with fasciclin (FAS1) repeats